jgi:hypothetical protein
MHYPALNLPALTRNFLQHMKAAFLYVTAWSAGGHELLSAISPFLNFAARKFGDDITELDVNVHFDLETAPLTEMDELPFHLKPRFKLKDGGKRLRIEYTSKYLPFENDQPFGEYQLRDGSVQGCRRFELLLREFRDVIVLIGPSISKKSDFSWPELTRVIEESFANLPTKDEQIRQLNELAREAWFAQHPEQAPGQGSELSAGEELQSCAPWDSDRAADWFAALMDSTQLPLQIMRTINQKVDVESAEQIRAAASLVMMLGRTYVWPIDDLDHDLATAARQLRKVAVITTNQDLREVIQAEVDFLESASAEKNQSEQFCSLWNKWLQ